MTIDEIFDEVETLLIEQGIRPQLLHWDLSHNEGDAPNLVTLDRIQIREEFEEQGWSDKALKVFTRYCDQHSLDAKLTVRRLTERTNLRRLRRLYTRNGFIADVGRKNGMTRRCQRSTAP